MRFSKRHFVGAFLLSAGLGSLLVQGGVRKQELELSAAQPQEAAHSSLRIAAGEILQARVGVEFEFLPTVSNPAHDSLRFSAENLPPWARFDAASGRLMGTPQTTDIGQYESITMTVSDGSQSVSTRPFSIAVVGANAAVATVQWSVPLSKADGSALDDLAGYRIVYGRDPEELDHSIFIADPAQTSYQFSTLASGAWYFAVVAVSASGLESPPSVAARKTI